MAVCERVRSEDCSTADSVCGPGFSSLDGGVRASAPGGAGGVCSSTDPARPRLLSNTGC